MKIPIMKIKFFTENSAFDDDNQVPEICRILNKIQKEILSGKIKEVIHCSNGNPIGNWILEERKDN